MSVKTTYFVHGTTTDNEKEISSGWSDVELSEPADRIGKNLISSALGLGHTRIYDLIILIHFAIL